MSKDKTQDAIQDGQGENSPQTNEPQTNAPRQMRPGQ